MPNRSPRRRSIASFARPSLGGSRHETTQRLRQSSHSIPSCRLPGRAQTSIVPKSGLRSPRHVGRQRPNRYGSGDTRPGVDDYTAVIVVVVFAFIMILVLLTRMIVTIQPGQIGLAFLMGQYRWGLLPGLNVVHPFSYVVKVTPGSGPNKALGMLGTAETDLAPDLPPGNVRIGEMQVTARGATRIPGDTTVRVIQDVSPGLVLVAKEHERFGGPKVPRLPPAGGPLS